MSRSVQRQVVYVAVFLVVVVLFMTMFRMGIVRGQSMEPTYENGQVVLVQRRTWFSRPLRRNDVVLLRHDRDVLIKRIYRLGGEELTNDIYPYTAEMALNRMVGDYYEQVPAIRLPGAPPPRLYVPKGYLVVLGDNIKNSEDSKDFGPVPVRDVLGVVMNSPLPPYAGANP